MLLFKLILFILCIIFVGISIACKDPAPLMAGLVFNILWVLVFFIFSLFASSFANKIEHKGEPVLFELSDDNDIKVDYRGLFIIYERDYNNIKVPRKITSFSRDAESNYDVPYFIKTEYKAAGAWWYWPINGLNPKRFDYYLPDSVEVNFIR